MKDSTILTIYTTISNEEEAKKLIRILLENRLIACGVSWEVNSQYNWKGETVNDGEFVVFMKSSIRFENSLIGEIEKIHPYDTPAILMNETKVNRGYFEWVEEEVK